MSIGQSELVNRLKSGGVQFEVHEHVPVLTVQAQVRSDRRGEQASWLLRHAVLRPAKAGTRHVEH